jgi:arsenical pump membrane protein
MAGWLAVVALFIFTSAVTVYFIQKKPYLRLRVLHRDIQIESYFIGGLLGPLLILAFGILNYSQVVGGLSGEQNLNPFGILVLFLSMVFLSIFLDTTGFFEYCARLALRFAGRKGTRLFFSLYAVVSLLTIFTSNDIIILTFTPFIYYFARDAGISPKPYLIAEFFAANTWSMMLYIGNPTNILIASAFDLRFDEYTRWMLLPTLAAGVTSVLLLYRIFSAEIRRPLREYCSIDPKAAITDRTGAILGLLLLSSCIIALIIAPYYGIEMWTVSLSFAIFLLLILIARDSTSVFAKGWHPNGGTLTVPSTLRRMPWTVVPFVLSLFVTVQAMRAYGITGEIGRMFAALGCGYEISYPFIYGIASALSANILNNIPMTVAFVPVIQSLSGDHLTAAAFATVIGSNLGANITPLGSLAGIMWIGILHGKEFEFSFREFAYYGLLVTPLTLVSCLGVLALEFLLF